MKSTQEPPTHLLYRPEIDGLRAIAVTLVLLYHAELGFPQGFLGVDVFFVISGFLITKIISPKISNGKFSLSDFLFRRAMRLLPASFTIYCLVLFLGFFLLLPRDLIQLSKCTASSACFLSNIFLWKTTNYFASESATKPLLHTWSLSVEEQFYFIYPWLLILIAKNNRKSPTNQTLLAIIFLGTASFLSYLVINLYKPVFAFYMIWTRAWEMLIGAFAASLKPRRVGHHSQIVIETLIIFGIILISAFKAELLPAGLTSLVVVSGTGLLLYFPPDTRDTPVRKILSSKLLVYMGGISYSLYLCHWPVLAFAKYWSTSAWSTHDKISLLVLSFTSAVALNKIVESPMRKMAQSVQHRKFLVFSFFSGLSLMLCALAGFVESNDGFVERLPENTRYVLPYLTTPKYVFCKVEDLKNDNPIWIGNKLRRDVDFVVWGDSMAWAQMPAFDFAATKLGLRGAVIWAPSNPPLVNPSSGGTAMPPAEQETFTNEAWQLIERLHPRKVILIARWGSYKTDDVKSGLLESTRRLRKSTNSSLILEREVPTFAEVVPRAILKRRMLGQSLNGLKQSKSEHKRLTEHSNEIIEEISDVTIADPANFLTDSTGDFQVSEGVEIYYFDTMHLTVDGARKLIPFASDLLARP